MSNSQRQDSSDQETTGSYSYPYGMDQSGQQQQIVMGVVPTQIAYGPGAYPGVQMVPSGAAPVPAPGQPTSSYTSAAVMGGQHQIAYQQVQHLHNQQAQQQQEQLQNFWTKQVNEIDDATDFRNHNLPLARIKKIMKADEDVKMISAEAPVVFAKACEMFILELTLRSWFHTEENRRRTLQKNDIAAAITRTDIFDFLVDIVPRDELKEEGLGLAGAALPAGAGGSAESVPYYYLPQHGAPGMMMGQPVDQATAAMYTPQQPHPMTYMPWPQPPAQAQQHRQDQPNQQQGSTTAPDP